MFEHEAIATARANIHLARQQREPARLRNPPSPHELGLGPRLEHDARRCVEFARDDDLALRLLFHSRLVLHRCALSFSFCFMSSITWSSSSKRALHTHLSLGTAKIGGASGATGNFAFAVLGEYELPARTFV